ncbi:hypothetical protein [Streptomyces violaceorubidus]|uniref:hypothetical protein n=1 Tax=Streptomyces violaceorubidus TaxID=284042 RepID=UPI000997FDAF|nr:hypothetical protein [Streptomyces violaceorubidus]
MPDMTGKTGADPTVEPGTTAGPRPGPTAAEHEPGPTAESRPGTAAEHEPGTTAEHEPGVIAESRPATTAEHEPGVTVGSGAGSGPGPGTTAAVSAADASAGASLLPPGESDRLGRRLHHAVAGFVDAPRASVEEADRVLEEIAARFTDAVTHRRRTLRTSWREAGADSGAPSTDTEQLRLALRDYRELADRLMRL